MSFVGRCPLKGNILCREVSGAYKCLLLGGYMHKSLVVEEKVSVVRKCA